MSDVQRAGNGARGIVSGSTGANGHVFNVVNVRGKVIFLDGQNGYAGHAPKWDAYAWIRTD
ncbi:toxin glutamine deamidase domain-containing protein [Streptomyces sp. NPDC058426]|uniref:toxin glutamine deamidase domain-containing protein n=1 Tax=unclassified Streptomyces TaxID=2593676 RepID=UPI00364E9743